MFGRGGARSPSYPHTTAVLNCKNLSPPHERYLDDYIGDVGGKIGLLILCYRCFLRILFPILKISLKISLGIFSGSYHSYIYPTLPD